ncbi:MAG: asparagine synthase (glutamine-hydrolyzing) [Rhodospirillaceae bacterium]|nr:asparagine synthase (glutamine-hydrolyzing) [Rhodospirillaceae bacterium]MBT5458004.1 asparagine synthase (glutamine-hydrolyzing) [Rhodospirillaceae bacterium]
MCGIAAIFAYNIEAPPPDRAQLHAMHDSMAARGPDGEGLWVSDEARIAMAHRRLSIIDLTDSGAQPMASSDGSLRIVFNGEIYNYQTLRAELIAEGARFVSESDTEVLLHLYAKRGPDMVRSLRGMFAFAIWDERRRGLFMARDPYGIKPLYYADDGKTFRIASQVKALLAGGGIDTRPEPAGHTGFFLFGNVPEPFTLFRGIKSLPAGGSLWVDTSGCGEPRRWFDLTAELANAEATPLDMDALRAALLDSVRHHMIADVPVGAFLSSGLDSATLVSLATEIEGSNLRTVTLGFDAFRGRADDETPLAETIAAHYGTTHETRWIDQANFEAESEPLFAAMDQPTIDGVNTYFVSKVAREAGLKVALSGLGGDELFGGYTTFREVPLLVRALGIFRFLPGIGRAFRWVSASTIRRMASPKYAGLFEYGARYGDAYLLRRGFFMPWELPEVLDPDMVRDGLERLAPRRHLSETAAPLRTPHLKVSALESAWYMRNQLLRDSDWASMAHSLEIRTPLVDVELLRAVAPMLAGNRPASKLDMASTPAKSLPDEVLGRPKTGFSVPVREWLSGGRVSVDNQSYRDWARFVYDRYTGAVA